MKQKRHGAFLIMMACVAFIFVARSPRFSTLHNVDMLLLFVSGACAGVGAAVLVLKRSAE